MGNVGSYDARKIAEARVVLEEKARELGVKLEAVMGVGTARKKAAVSAKYRDPENPALTWSGRGRTPNWILAHEAQGGSRDDLLIN